MTEVKREVKTHRIYYICDKCKKGRMEPTDDMLFLVYPPLYPHVCSYCGEKKEFWKKYPMIVYED